MKSEAGGGSGGLSGGAEIESKKTFDWNGDVPEGVVCPACFGELRAAVEKLICAGCGRRYPVVDGIPVLIVERAG